MAFATITDRHVAGESFVHRLDPRAKLVVTLAYIFCAILTPNGQWEVFGALALLFACVLAASGLRPLLVFRRALLALPFVLAALPVLFNHDGRELFSLPLVGWTATWSGFEALTSILVRSWLSVLMATVLTATTEADLILRSLRWLGVPRILVATISFMWRYIFVIGEEAQRLLRARESRSARPYGKPGGSLCWRARVAGNMVGSLFLRSMARSERVYSAMLARGYNGELRSLDRLTLSARDAVAAGAAVVLLLTLQAYARL